MEFNGDFYYNDDELENFEANIHDDLSADVVEITAADFYASNNVCRFCGRRGCGACELIEEREAQAQESEWRAAMVSHMAEVRRWQRNNAGAPAESRKRKQTDATGIRYMR